MSEWNQAQHHARRARRFYRAGQWERALEELREALERRPHEGDWWFGLGLTLDALDRYDEAADAFEKALKQRGEDVPGLLHLGIDLLRAGNPGKAIGVFEQMNRLDPGVELGYVHRVLAYGLLGMHDQAELMFYLGLQVAEDDPSGGDDRAQAMAHDHMAQSLLVRGDHTRAVWCWQEALRRDPAHPDAHRSLAIVHQYLDQDDKARLHFAQQLEINPSDIETLMDFADHLLKHGRSAEAGEKYRRALEYDPTRGLAHQRLGDIALSHGHYGAATDRYERAGQLDPSLPGVRLGLATVCHERRDHAGAKRWLTGELAVEGQTPEQVLELAAMLVELSENGEAIRLLNPLLSGADDLLMAENELYAMGLLCRAAAWVGQGDLTRGILDCERCLSVVPGHRIAILQLTTAYYQAGRFEDARRWLARGLENQPDDPELRQIKRKLWRAQALQGIRRWLGGSR
ncbi:MAG: tetratricopeptide repeat protein [Planctomycetota bacterium]